MVTGTVTEESGETVIGANVMVKDLHTGTITDIDGNYSISVPEDATLVFSSVGMETQEIRVSGRATINVVLKLASVGIEEVVVTAFATQKKVNVTGAISTVSGRDILAAPVANISNALVGVAPGVSAVQAGGEPGRNESDITIRGVATYGSTAPLIVIDGVEQAAEQAFTAFNTLDANEILGISILKDASSTAVYGIRAANGVIIVTTKRGSAGKPKVSLSTSFGVTKATSLQKGLSSYDWAMFRNEGVQNEINAFGNNALAAYLYNEDDLWKFKNNRDFTP